MLLDDRCTGGPSATNGVLWRRPGAPAIGAAHTVLVGQSRPVVCRRRVGALGWPSSSRRRNIEQSPQYGPHLLTVRKPRRRDHARLGRRSDANARRGWRNRVPAETGFCFGRCYAALSLGARPKMAAAAVKSPVSARKRTCGGGHSVVDGKEICCREILMHCRRPKRRPSPGAVPCDACAASRV